LTIIENNTLIYSFSQSVVHSLITAFSTYHDHGRCLVREHSPSLHGHKPGINYLLTFATLPHTRLLNITSNHFYLASPAEFGFYHTAF